MAVRFDFGGFARDSQVTTLVTALADVVSQTDNAAVKTGVEQFKKQFKISGNSDPAPDFKFTLAARSYDDVVKHCIERGRNLKKVVHFILDRCYAARNFETDPDYQIWEEVSSPSTVDIHEESSKLSFLDAGKKHVDWSATLENLNRMAEGKPYSEAMMRTCLMRFINHYECTQSEYLKDKNCNDIANFLLALNPLTTSAESMA